MCVLGKLGLGYVDWGAFSHRLKAPHSSGTHWGGGWAGAFTKCSGDQISGFPVHQKDF